MTRRHFEMIARTINRAIHREDGKTTSWAQARREAARDMAYVLAAQLGENPQFDAKRFLAACFAGTEFES